VEFSPDGGTVFVAQEEPRGGIAVIDVHLLAYDMVFASNREGESYQVYLMNAAERKPLRLTKNHASDRYPCWSSDGQSIAFISDREGTPRIFVMDRSGSVKHSFEKTDPLLSSSSQETSLDWSPDGAEIAVIGMNKKAVKIVNVASGEVRTVIDGAIPPDYAWLRGLSWRKSDGKILINGQHPASVFQQDIFLLDPKTRDIQQITNSQGGPAHWSAPAASRDGQKLAALRVSNSGPPLSQIFLLNADGTLPTPLSKDLRALMNNLRWSPDGRYLVYSETTNNVSHIQIVGIKDEKPLSLTTGAGEDIEPDVFGRSPPQGCGDK
jgi:Tol biopolymer transport system component